MILMKRRRKPVLNQQVKLKKYDSVESRTKAIHFNNNASAKPRFCGANGHALKGKWKKIFKDLVKESLFTVSNANGSKNCWKSVENEIQGSNQKSESSSSSSKSLNYLVNKEEKDRVLKQYTDQKDEDKWILSNDKVVEDTMKKAVEDSKFEHPAFSYIIDPSDPLWARYFTERELKEIRNHQRIKLPVVSKGLQEYIDTFDTDDLRSAEDYYGHAVEAKLALRDFDKRWVQESFIDVAKLSVKNDILDLNEISEADLLNRVWAFIYKAFDGEAMKAKLGEKCSVANAIGRNVERRLESEDKRVPKKKGAKVDILFEEGVNEFGCCEVEKSDVTSVDNKYLDDGMYKQPKVLRDILLHLISINPSKTN